MFVSKKARLTQVETKEAENKHDLGKLTLPETNIAPGSWNPNRKGSSSKYFWLRAATQMLGLQKRYASNDEKKTLLIRLPESPEFELCNFWCPNLSNPWILAGAQEWSLEMNATDDQRVTPWKINMEPKNVGLETGDFHVPCFSRGQSPQTKSVRSMRYKDWGQRQLTDLRWCIQALQVIAFSQTSRRNHNINICLLNLYHTSSKTFKNHVLQISSNFWRLRMIFMTYSGSQDAIIIPWLIQTGTPENDGSFLLWFLASWSMIHPKCFKMRPWMAFLRRKAPDSFCLVETN